MSFRAKTIAFVAVAALAFSSVALMPATADGSDYCSTPEGQQDIRCKDGYCETPNGQRDPYCYDPHYCERYADDPICQKVTTTEKKELCVWYVDGAPVGSLVPIMRQANPGPHMVRLECPNHQLADWECKVKAREQGPVPSTGKDADCKYHGAKVDPASCAATFVWTVVVPDFNTWTIELSARTYKVEPVPDPTGMLVACKGPVDWNTSSIGVDPDGTVRVKCVLENEYLAKDYLWKQDNTWHHYSQNKEGSYEYHTHPNHPSMPDKKIDECDFQSYSIQWRQWN